MTKAPKPTKTERLARERLLKNFNALEYEPAMHYYVEQFVPEAWTTLAQDIDVEERRVKVTLWLDESVAKFYRATGKGWHARVSRVLATYAQLQIANIRDVEAYARKVSPDGPGLVHTNS